MSSRSRIEFICVISFIALAAVKASSKYYDGESRPYEFGYRIEGNQHRHEKKDASGIINGEFGFITGDGAYHSSVYATDENGNFKLVSLRTSFKIVKPTTTTTTAAPVPISREPKSLEPAVVLNVKTCSSCKVIEKGPSSPSFTSTNSKTAALTLEGDLVPPNVLAANEPKDDQEQINHSHPQKSSGDGFDRSKIISPLNVALGIAKAGIKSVEQLQRERKEENASNDQRSNDGSDKSSKSSSSLSSPKSTDTEMNIQDTNQRTGKQLQHDKLTSSKLSSKKAITEFIGDVLYRFNYTAGYHGHSEEGDTAGNKMGSYFIIGRDNIRRGVIYVANGNGFKPVVKYEKVSPAEAPHEDTEKNAGLKGYEFEWFNKGRST